MPRLLGVNVLGGFLAAIAMFMVGFVWYGLAFSQIWMDARGFELAQFEGQSPAWLAGGFLIEIVAAFGIGWLMKRLGISTFGAAVGFAVTLALLIGVPLMSYEFVYGAFHSVAGWLVDASHILVTIVAGAAVLSFFD